MNRTAWLQERRMQKFIDVLGRYEANRLCGLEAAEILGMPERTFRHYRERYEAAGLDRLVDDRLGNRPAHAVPVDEIEWMLEQYREYYVGWTAKHYHDHLVKQHSFNWGYTWTKNLDQDPASSLRIAGRGAAPRGASSQTATQAVCRNDAASGRLQPCLDLPVKSGGIF